MKQEYEEGAKFSDVYNMPFDAMNDIASPPMRSCCDFGYICDYCAYS